MKRTILSLVAIAVVPAVLAAQNPPQQQGKRDTTRADSILNRPVNQTNQTGDTTGRGRAAPTGQQGQRDSLPADRAAQGTTPGRAVNQANEAGDTTPSALRDSLLRASQGAVVERGGEVTRSRASSRSFGLERPQVMQLQEALNGIGCDVGAVDGIVGPRTRAGVACARTQKGISGDDNQALFQALNLDFGGTGAAGAADTTGAADSSMVRDSSLMRDSTTRDSSVTPDSTVKPDSAMKRDTTMKRDSSTTRPDSTRPTPPR